MEVVHQLGGLIEILVRTFFFIIPYDILRFLGSFHGGCFDSVEDPVVVVILVVLIDRVPGDRSRVSG